MTKTFEQIFNEQLGMVIKPDEVRDYLRGQQLCIDNVPHDENWSEATTRGYSAQYMLEQNQGAR